MTHIIRCPRCRKRLVKRKITRYSIIDKLCRAVDVDTLEVFTALTVDGAIRVMFMRCRCGAAHFIETGE